MIEIRDARASESRTSLLVAALSGGAVVGFAAVGPSRDVDAGRDVGELRHHPWAQRWARVTAEVERLTRLGAQVVHEVVEGDRPDHVVMVDPEGNEFCVVWGIGRLR